MCTSIVEIARAEGMAKRGDEWFYGVFWEGMPDLNFRNPEVEEEFIKIGDHPPCLLMDLYCRIL